MITELYLWIFIKFIVSIKTGFLSIIECKIFKNLVAQLANFMVLCLQHKQILHSINYNLACNLLLSQKSLFFYKKYFFLIMKYIIKDCDHNSI